MKKFLFKTLRNLAYVKRRVQCRRDHIFCSSNTRQCLFLHPVIWTVQTNRTSEAEHRQRLWSAFGTASWAVNESANASLWAINDLGPNHANWSSPATKSVNDHLIPSWATRHATRSNRHSPDPQACSWSQLMNSKTYCCCPRH